MGSEQHIPGELPDLRRVGLLAIDSEEKDNGLATDRGSGWPWRDGHVCGISVAYRADGHLHGFYFPMRHPDTQNFAPEQVYAWLKDHVAADLRFITHNGPFDWGWFRAEAGIRMPPSARDCRDARTRNPHRYCRGRTRARSPAWQTRYRARAIIGQARDTGRHG